MPIFDSARSLVFIFINWSNTSSAIHLAITADKRICRLPDFLSSFATRCISLQIAREVEASRVCSARPRLSAKLILRALYACSSRPIDIDSIESNWHRGNRRYHYTLWERRSQKSRAYLDLKPTFPLWSCGTECLISRTYTCICVHTCR